MAGTLYGADQLATNCVLWDVDADAADHQIADASGCAAEIQPGDPLEYMFRDANLGSVYDEVPAYDGPQSLPAEILQRVIPQWWRGPGYPNQDDPNIASYSGPKAAVPSFFQVRLPMALSESKVQRDVALAAATQGQIADLNSYAGDGAVPFVPAPMPLWAFAGMARSFNLSKLLRTNPKLDWEILRSQTEQAGETWFVKNLRRRGLLRQEPKKGRRRFEGLLEIAQGSSESAPSAANLLFSRALSGGTKEMQDLTTLLTKGTAETDVLELIIRRARLYTDQNPAFALHILNLGSASKNSIVKVRAGIALRDPKFLRLLKTPN